MIGSRFKGAALKTDAHTARITLWSWKRLNACGPVVYKKWQACQYPVSIAKTKIIRKLGHRCARLLASLEIAVLLVYHLYHLYHRNISSVNFVRYHWLSLCCIIDDLFWKMWITDPLATSNQQMLAQLKGDGYTAVLLELVAQDHCEEFRFQGGKGSSLGRDKCSSDQ